MKVYCSRNQYENELDRYVGTDYWVKCRVQGHGELYWAHLLEKTKTGYLVISVSDYYLNNPHGSFSKSIFYDLQQQKDAAALCHASSLSMAKPNEVLSTDELVSTLDYWHR